MIFNIITLNEICYQFVQANDIALLYYSHIPTALIALLMSFFVFIKSKKTLSSKLLLVIAVLFCIWSGLDLAIWTSFDTRLTMFFWSPLGVFSMLLVAFSLYFTYVFFDGSDISFGKKMAIFGPILPAILLMPTTFNLNTFNAVSCEAVENVWFVKYANFFGFFVIAWIIVLAFRRYRQADIFHKQQIVFFTIGIELFLFSFFVTSYLASLLGNFNLVIYGLFGMPVFMAFLAYIIVKYRVFTIKILGTQALVLALIFLIGAQFFYAKTQTSFILTTVTFLLVIVTGILLIQSLKRSEERKEELQRVNLQLKRNRQRLTQVNEHLMQLDQAKTDFINIASHQLRTPLGGMRWSIEMLLGDEVGAISDEAKETIRQVYENNQRMVVLVNDLLNVARIEQGKVVEKQELTDITLALNEAVNAMQVEARHREMSLKLEVLSENIPSIMVAPKRFFEVIQNLISNAIKYNRPNGSVTVTLQTSKKHMRISVADTGIGIPRSEQGKIFSKFFRAGNALASTVEGTGLGLFVVKSFVEENGGIVRFQSAEGVGTTFIIELPLKSDV